MTPPHDHGPTRPAQRPHTRDDAPVSADAHLLTETVTRLRRALRAAVRTEYSWEKLPMAQVELLQVLERHSPMRVSDLATQRRLAPSTVSRLIGQMLHAGLVDRGTDPDDRRAAVVSLTPAGRRQLTDWVGANQDRIGDALAALPQDAQRRIHAALPALRALTDLLERDA